MQKDYPYLNRDPPWLYQAFVRIRNSSIFIFNARNDAYCWSGTYERGKESIITLKGEQLPLNRLFYMHYYVFIKCLSIDARKCPCIAFKIQHV
jgi:hypothetical protein